MAAAEKKIPEGSGQEPHTDEVQRRIDFVEKATGRKVVLFQNEWTPASRRAAALAAQIAYGFEADPKNLPQLKDRSELIGLLGLEAQTPFKPMPCPLFGERLDKALAYIRECFKLNTVTGTDRDLAIAFVKWAKENAQ